MLIRKIPVLIIKYKYAKITHSMSKKGFVLMKTKIKNTFLGQADLLKKLSESTIVAEIENTCAMLVDCLSRGNKILIAGNGGSAADAQHFAAELVGRFMKERKGLAAIALTTDTSIITSVANDYSYDVVFSRQVEALGKAGDVFIGFSTSGNSGSIINAAEKAHELGMKVIGFSGKNGGKMTSICDEILIIPSDTTARIQEIHEMIIHLTCEEIENQLFD